MLLVHNNDDAMLMTLTRAGLVKLCGEHSIHSSIGGAARALNAPVQVFSPPPVGQMNLRKKNPGRLEACVRLIDCLMCLLVEKLATRVLQASSDIENQRDDHSEAVQRN